MMAGFYIQHNTTIGLQCFAWGLFFGLGSLYELLSNGDRSSGRSSATWRTSPHAANFFTFVTAHGPFELTAIVFSGAAGLRLGYGPDRHAGPDAPGLAPPRGDAAPCRSSARRSSCSSWRRSSKGSSRPPPCPTPPRRRSPWSAPACSSPTSPSGGRSGPIAIEARWPSNRHRVRPPARRVWPIDRTLVQIRERSFLDVLDLALVVVRQRPVTLGLAALAGIAPFAALNAWLTSDPEFPLGAARLSCSSWRSPGRPPP